MYKYTYMFTCVKMFKTPGEWEEAETQGFGGRGGGPRGLAASEMPPAAAGNRHPKESDFFPVT